MTPALFQSTTRRVAALAATLSGIDAALRAETSGLSTDVLASGDVALIHAFFPARTDFAGSLTGDALCKSLLHRQMLLLSGAIRNCLLPGVTDPASFAAYYNTGPGGPYQCLVPEGFAAAYKLVVGISLRPADIAAPAASLGQRSVGGALLPGTSIDGDWYAGAVPVASVQESTFTRARAAGAGMLIVRGQARDRSGIVVPDREFSALLSGDGDAPLTAAESGDLLLSVGSLTLPPNMSAGTVTVKSD